MCVLDGLAAYGSGAGAGFPVVETRVCAVPGLTNMTAGSMQGGALACKQPRAASRQRGVHGVRWFVGLVPGQRRSNVANRFVEVQQPMEMVPMQNRRFLSVQEVAVELRVPEAAVAAAVKAGELPCLMVDGACRIPAHALVVPPGRRTPGWRKGAAALVAVAALALTWNAVADVLPTDAPLRRTIPYAGTAERDGLALEGQVPMSFTIENEGGGVLWGPEAQNVAVSGGRFAVELGAVLALTPAVLNAREARLAVTVNGQPLAGRQRILTVLSDAAGANTIPAGTIQAFGGNTVPVGWLLCDGSAVDGARYPQLFAALGTAWGNGTTGNNAVGGVTNFNLPDLRGRFLRGASLATGRDPGAPFRVPSAAGGAAGDSVGTLQDSATRMPGNPFVTGDDAPDHGHNFGVHGGTFGDGAGAAGMYTGFALRETRYTSGATARHRHAIFGGDAESRPFNASVNYIIRY